VADHEALMSENGLHNLLGIAHIRKALPAVSDRVDKRQKCYHENVLYETKKWMASTLTDKLTSWSWPS
jgi:hypothetical protein